MRLPFLFFGVSLIVLTIIGFKMPLFATSADKKSPHKVVLISGAASGIGLATVQMFHKHGWKVWAGYHQQISPELKKMSGVSTCQLDVTDDASVAAAIAAILNEDGRIDVLINNAGYGLIGAEECVTIDEARQQFEVNFFGVLRLTQAVLPTMRAQRSGHILNISSGVGVHSFPGLGIYSASKFALESMSESLAATVSPWNIKVSIIEPGFVHTHWGKHCTVGTRSINEPFYKNLTQGMINMLAVPQGQPTQEVAALLLEIAENSEPNMRYQTSSGMQEYIAERLVDTTGNVARDGNIEYVNRFMTRFSK